MAIVPTKKMEKALVQLFIKNGDEKRRRKALRFAVSTPDVEAAGLTGEDRKQVIMVGIDQNWGELAVKMKNKIGAQTKLQWIEDIDWAGLTESMRYIGNNVSGRNAGSTVGGRNADSTAAGSNAGTTSCIGGCAIM